MIKKVRHTMKGIHITRMRESDLDAVSDLSILANPHAVKEKYRANLVRWLNEFGEWHLWSRKMVQL